MEIYTYTSLPQDCHFRLVHLEPGSKNDELRCHLEGYSFILPAFLDAIRKDTRFDDYSIISILGTIQLDPLSVPKYKALSFVWGDLSPTCKIVCCYKTSTARELAYYFITYKGPGQKSPEFRARAL
jgi:hypothetical protein